MLVIAIVLSVVGIYLAFYSNILLAFLALAAGVWFGVAGLGRAADATHARPRGGTDEQWLAGDGGGGGPTTRDDRARCGGGDSVSGDSGGGSTSDCGGGGE
ncbi:hypothetical protein [Nocardia sp. NPDC057353]|uniref:hypothetical protein n=1 Tax=Nocardia sp. NPDC057353 TaxID=3346104 RepID=UPI00363960C8